MFNAKHFLRQCRSELKETIVLTERLNQLRASLLPEAIRYKDMDIQTSGPKDIVAERMPEIIEQERIVQERLHILADHQSYAYRLINQLEDSRHRQLLTLYYLDSRMLTWQQVAAIMGYEERQIFNIHGDALKRISEKAE